jgi:hypothetical protein
MSIRERTWYNSKGVRSIAMIVNWTDADGKRRIKTFKSRKEAERFAALVSRPDHRLNLRMTARRIREVSKLMEKLADELMSLGTT